MDNFARGWLVGIIEGEGSIFLARKNKTQAPRYPTIQVKMTDEDTIRRLYAITKCGQIFGPHHSPSMTKDCRKTGKTTRRLPTWTWRTNGNDAWVLLELLVDNFSNRRKEQAMKVIEAPRYA